MKIRKYSIIRNITLAAGLTLALALAGCGEKTGTKLESQNSVDQVINEKIAEDGKGFITLFPQYIDEGKYYYDYTTVYVKIEPIANDSCVTTSSSYTTCAEYVLYDRMPEDRSTLYFTRTPSDSVSCTANSGVLYTSVAKCELLYEENGKYNSEDYNYYWYKEYASIKPTAESNRAFVAMENVLREDTEWVKFIVLPFVVVEGDTVMADGVAATPSIFKVDAE